MPGVGTQLLLLLLLTAVVSARPADTTDNKMESAKRKARFGDYSFLCDLLCETVEETETDCSYPDWLSFDICETICEDSSSSSSTTLKTTTTTQVTEATKTISEKPMPTTTVEPSSTTDPAMTSASSTETTTAAVISSSSETTTAAVVSSSPETTTASPETTSISAESTTPEAATETTEPMTSQSPDDDSLVGSPNDVDIVIVGPSDALNSSSALLESQESSDKAVSWPEFKTRLMPYLPELIKLWCDWRDIFTNPQSTTALERLCPSVEEAPQKPSIIFNYPKIS